MAAPFEVLMSHNNRSQVESEHICCNVLEIKIKCRLSYLLTPTLDAYLVTTGSTHLILSTMIYSMHDQRDKMRLLSHS